MTLHLALLKQTESWNEMFMPPEYYQIQVPAFQEAGNDVK